MIKAERYERIKVLSWIAPGLARRGGLQGNIDINDSAFRLYEIQLDEITMAHYRSIDADVASTLDVRWLGAKVLAMSG